MIYTGQFRDLSDQLYTIKVTTATEGENKTLLLGGTPFTTEMDTEGETIYAPAKYQAATLNLVTADYLFDLYQPTAHGASVEMKKGNSVVWTGYVSPTLYNQGYESSLEEISVDCIDGLSSLQYYKYRPINTEKDVHSFKDIMLHCVKKAGCYTKLILPLSTRLASNHDADLWRNCYISEQNFIDKDATKDDEKNTATYKEVMERICQYMGVTVYAEGSSVIVRDLDYSDEGISISVATGAVTSVSVSGDVTAITGESYAASGATLSLDKVYSKVSVTDEFETFDSMLPDFFDGAENITVNDTDALADTYGEYVNLSSESKMLAFIAKASRPQSYIPVKNALFIKYYAPKNYTLHGYNAIGHDDYAALALGTNYTKTQNHNGAFLCKVMVKELDSKWQEDDNWTGKTFDDVVAEEDINELEFTDYIILTNHKDFNIPDSSQLQKPYIEMNANAITPAFFGGSNAYLVISGSVNYQVKDADVFPVPSGEVDLDDGRKKLGTDKAVLTCKLQWGDLYWNGSAWQSTSTTFNIPWLKEETRRDEICYKDTDIVNKVTWRIGSSEKGYLIKMPDNGAIASGQPKLTLYKPLSTKDENGKNDNYVTLLKNFKMIAIYADPTLSDEQEDDTTYTNVIDEGHTEELSTISLKVCTMDGKKPNYNSVAYLTNGSYQFLDETYHPGLSSAEVGIERYDGSVCSGTMRQEEHLVFKIVKQHERPAKVLELSLNTRYPLNTSLVESNLGCTFVIDSVSCDYQQMCYRYKLVQKI